MEENFHKYKKPDPLELRALTKELTGWAIEGGRLEKNFQFKNFARAMVFVNKIVNPIEENQNYPKITITYNRVQVSLFTNEAGGITFMDVEMAREIQTLSGEKAPGILA